MTFQTISPGRHYEAALPDFGENQDPGGQQTQCPLTLPRSENRFRQNQPLADHHLNGCSADFSAILIKSRLLVVGVDREHFFERPRAIFYVDLPFRQCWR